jgi:hypothetical protein
MKLVYALRLRDVPANASAGRRRVEAYVADSGQDPAEAFGPARRTPKTSRRVAPEAGRRRRFRELLAAYPPLWARRRGRRLWAYFRTAGAGQHREAVFAAVLPLAVVLLVAAMTQTGNGIDAVAGMVIGLGGVTALWAATSDPCPLPACSG